MNGDGRGTYSKEFYRERHENTLYAANTILSILLPLTGSVNSVVDVGCGVGTWLSVVRDRGTEKVRGLDGGWVDTELLEIPRENFRKIDLGGTESFHIEERFGLAISLEVAEHLPPEKAEDFVDLLVGLSPRVLFSAAIPGQGGVHHVNERWPRYWANLFSDRGYDIHDIIRPRIWNDERIPRCYRQNILFFSSREESAGIREPEPCPMPLDLVHPSLYLERAFTPDVGLKRAFKIFLGALKIYIGKKTGR